MAGKNAYIANQLNKLVRVYDHYKVPTATNQRALACSLENAGWFIFQTHPQYNFS